MEKNFVGPTAPDNRNEHAKTLNDLRRDGQRLEAIRYLGTLEANPIYMESRQEHKNILARASNEKVAEEMLSDIEAQAIIAFKKLGIIATRTLSGDGHARHQEEYELNDMRRSLDETKYLGELGSKVSKKEAAGETREAIAEYLETKSKEAFEELSKLDTKWYEALTSDTMTYVVDVTSAISSWFDGIRRILRDVKMSSANKEAEIKATEYGLLKWVNEEVQNNPDLDVSVIIDRVALQIKNIIKLTLEEEDI